MQNAEAMRDLSSSKARKPSPPERGASPGGDASPAPATLRVAAETLAAGAPQSLQLKAARLADLVLAGTHDRRHAGRGENFWQYRNATSGDPMGCCGIVSGAAKRTGRSAEARRIRPAVFFTRISLTARAPLLMAQDPHHAER